MANTQRVLSEARATLRNAMWSAEDRLTARERARLDERKTAATRALDGFDDLLAKHGESKALHLVTTAVDKYAVGVILEINTARRR
ncbi:hypothetical protein [Amycolatopsis sp. NPDC050768]|uniref:hypothetical protein n=1 Tax=Amycolatopsis sp. NPDC050768 TaxID=3154839 RepID=UPI0033DD3671